MTETSNADSESENPFGVLSARLFQSSTPIVPDPDGRPDKLDAKELDIRWKFFDRQFSYAWSFFDFHAKQRTTFFNYYLIAVGLLLNAYAQIIVRMLPGATIDARSILTALAGLGVVLSLLFWLLDRRNEQLAHDAEDMLIEMERDVLFGSAARKMKFPRGRSLFAPPGEGLRQLGILWPEVKHPKEFSPGIALGHGYLIPATIFATSIGYVVLAIVPWIV